MMTWILDHIKEIGIFTAIVGGLFATGLSLNALINWNWITYLFVIIRHSMTYIDFMVDTTALKSAMYIGFTVQCLYLATKGTMKVIQYFR